ncbi:serpentine type 7TM GPCR receptor class ab chemoreceptor domain-containing protein [Ditylenchus destructor]|nr:serpentine type 7TM GPCR receptor class ab chemoreceptor domain-containing protein [Ditylenchus destructor]
MNLNFYSPNGTNFSMNEHDLLIGGHWLFTLLNLLLSLYIIGRLKKITLIHMNLRLVLCYTFFIQYNLISIGRIGDELNVWITGYFEPSRPDLLPLRNLICIITKVIHDTGIVLSANADLLVLLERFLATFMKTYEKKGCKIGGAIVIASYCVCFTFISALFIYDQFMSDSYDIWSSTTSCHTSVVHPETILIFWYWSVCASTTGGIGLLLLYKFNRKMSHKWLGGNLGRRYQYNENVRTLRAVIPAIALNAFCFTIGLYFVRKMFTNYMEENSGVILPDTPLIQFIYAFADVYGLIFIVAFIIRNHQVAQILVNDIRSFCRNAKHQVEQTLDMSPSSKHKHGQYTVHPDKMTATHFEQLREMWK